MRRSTWKSQPRAALVRRVGAALQRRSVLLTGGPGMGRTHLLDEVVAGAERRGRVVDRITGSRATRAVPFAALAHLLPADRGDRSDIDVLVAARQAWRRPSGGRVLLAVDDLDLLDDSSLAALADAVSGGDVVVLATAAPEAEWSAGLRDLVGGAFAVLPLEPLTRDEIAAWARALLGGPVADRLIDELVEASGGEPAALRALLLGAQQADALVPQHGRWVGTAPLAGTGPMVELVPRRLDLPSSAIPSPRSW